MDVEIRMMVLLVGNPGDRVYERDRPVIIGKTEILAQHTALAGPTRERLQRVVDRRIVQPPRAPSGRTSLVRNQSAEYPLTCIAASPN
jgi:hypothetical protein